jgi:hypothetical protein
LKRINNEWKIMNMDTSNQDGYFELVSNTTIRLHIKDNGQFDANNALGVVSDPGGIAVVTTANYSLTLYEGSNPSDGVINLGDNITAKATTNDSSVVNVKFRWIDPSNNEVRNTTVNIVSGEASDTYTPNQVGTWKVVAEFSNGAIVVKELQVPFQVVPESIIGALSVIGSSLAVLAVYRRKRSI